MEKEVFIYMLIRFCQKEEVMAVGAFYDRVVQYLCEHINYPKWSYREYPSIGFVEEMTEAGSQLLCMEQEQILGAFVLNDDPQGAYENVQWSRELQRGSYLVCHALAVDPSLQGKGIGRQIVAFCMDYAREHQYQAVRLDVVPDNIPAKKLYEKCGFTYVGDVDLEREIPEIPFFSMYERNL